MPNIRLIIEYDGSAFHGWQLQDGVSTVQGELGAALRTVLRTNIAPLHASGRTDSGVHARAQVVTFKCDITPDFEALAWGVSSILRGRLSILKAEVAPDSFHPRTAAISKQYSYRILNRYAPATIDRGRAWEVQQKLDPARMREAAAAILGRHDFSAFRGSGCTAKTTVREIYQSELTFELPYITYRVVGEGFLKYMVRNIVGTLVGLGDGSLGERTFQSIIDGKDRRNAGVTAPAHGLYLDYVEYPDFISSDVTLQTLNGRAPSRKYTSHLVRSAVAQPDPEQPTQEEAK